MLKSLLYADLERQMELRASPVLRLPCRISLRKLFHPRFLPIVLYRASRAALLAGIPAWHTCCPISI